MSGPGNPMRADVDGVAAEFDVAFGSPPRVSAGCARIRARLGRPPTAEQTGHLRALALVLAKRVTEMAQPVFAVLEDALEAGAEPWPLLEPMLLARDATLARRALEQAVRLAGSGGFTPGREVALFLAEQVEKPDSALAERGQLVDIARLLRTTPGEPVGADPVRTMYVHERSPALRRLAARLLDLDGLPADRDAAARVLGNEASAFLAPHLDYTRATYLDLLHLAPEPGVGPPALASLRAAQAVCGEGVLRDLLAELGWERVNLGLELRPRLGISVNGSLPFFVAPAEAPLLDGGGGSRRVVECFLAVAQGGLPAPARAATGSEDPIARFRAYNLAHAEALGDLLDLTPLTQERVHRVLERMGGIVGEFVALFAAHWPECAILPGLYGDLRARVVAELEKQESPSQLSAELTRLVLMFEDPGGLAEVRTLHGLKRFLHQQGLRLGFRLVESGRATNRTVDLAVVTPKRKARVLRRIGFVDFDPDAGSDDPGAAAAEAGEPGADTTAPRAVPAPALPYPVAAVAEGFGLQLLHGQQSFPSVKIFCYGNETHYFLGFGNHPAFLRVDYAPPLQGGMLDLEFYGVSKYTLGQHPNPDLDALERCFRRLDLDVRIDSTRVHARYDKERVLDPDGLREKIEAVFRLMTYFMDLDWVIGDLDLPPAARNEVATAWAERLERWGVLPLDPMLSQDRRGIVSSTETGPAGERERLWPGEGSYRDRFTAAPPAGFFPRLRAAAAGLGLEVPSAFGENAAEFGQIPLERHVLQPLREALARGELTATAAGLRRVPADRFQREHEAEVFAEVLASGSAGWAPCAQVARLVSAVERSLRFQTTGTVNGYEVQRARLTLLEERVSLCVLRDEAGIARLALFAGGDALYRWRDDASRPWLRNRDARAGRLAALLRRNRYLLPGAVPPLPDPAEVAGLGDRFRRSNPLERPLPLPGEKRMAGLRASPGRGVGRAVLGVAGRAPADLEGAVLIAAGLRPEDAALFHRAAGLVSTGGGILSHAGILAVQMRKPALVVAGRWRETADGSPRVVFRTSAYREEERIVAGFDVCLRRDLHEREHELCEGDLVVVDADEGTLYVLGQDHPALALHQGLRLFVQASRRLAQAAPEAETLALRGHRLRAAHQIERLLARLSDPVLARHAAHEILLDEALTRDADARATQLRMLGLLLGNPLVAGPTRDYLARVALNLHRRHRASRERALERIPESDAPHEVLAMRREALRLGGVLDGTAAALRACGLEPAMARGADHDLDRLARGRLEALRAARLRAAHAASSLPRDPHLRHLLRQVERLDAVLGANEADRRERERMQAVLAREDDATLHRVESRMVLGQEECGFETSATIGWKAANLGEVGRLVGGGRVPPWFVVTHRAFEEMLAGRVNAAGVDGEAAGTTTLGGAIRAVLARADLNDAQKSARIRALWERTRVPGGLADEVAAAYRRLGADGPGGGTADDDPLAPFVAVRSSSHEEDTEAAARAGEFDTFLFVRGGERVLEYLKRAWSGLWSARAIHNRAVFGSGAEAVGGGIILQRIVNARASGVLQTVNLAEGELREIVVNAGLGLGEGVVSGAVATDHIVVAKEGDLERGPLRFRYLTADKRECVTFHRRAGFGTVRSECLYHQRLRPALEYSELSELIAVAARLETGYGYPLDIEFAIAGTRLWILQARPVAACQSAPGESLEPPPAGERRVHSPPRPLEEVRP